MKNILNIIISLLVCSFLLSACAEDGRVNKQGAGTAIGALAGAALGSQFGKGSGQLVGVGAGALLGGFIGNQIGQSMDAQDKLAMERASQHALEYQPSGRSTAWKNPDSGHSGAIKPLNTREENGRYCREFQQQVQIGGKEHQAYGVACRRSDGSWEIMQN